MRDRNDWQAHIEQAAYEAEVGGFEKLNILLDEIMQLQEAAQQKREPDAAKPRRRMVVCPECETMFGVELS